VQLKGLFPSLKLAQTDPKPLKLAQNNCITASCQLK
jgi:hypothetical protein